MYSDPNLNHVLKLDGRKFDETETTCLQNPKQIYQRYVSATAALSGAGSFQGGGDVHWAHTPKGVNTFPVSSHNAWQSTGLETYWDHYRSVEQAQLEALRARIRARARAEEAHEACAHVNAELALQEYTALKMRTSPFKVVHPTRQQDYATNHDERLCSPGHSVDIGGVGAIFNQGISFTGDLRSLSAVANYLKKSPYAIQSKPVMKSNSVLNDWKQDNGQNRRGQISTALLEYLPVERRTKTPQQISEESHLHYIRDTRPVNQTEKQEEKKLEEKECMKEYKRRGCSTIGKASATGTTGPASAGPEKVKASKEKNCTTGLTERDNGRRGPGRPCKKRKRPRKAQDMPKRPLSAYNIFFRQERARILDSIPNRPGFEAADKDKEKILLEAKMKETNAAVGMKFDGRANAADSDLSAAAGGAQTRSLRFSNPHGKISFQELGKMIGGKWNALTPERRQHFQDLAQQDAIRYKREMEAWVMVHQRK